MVRRLHWIALCSAVSLIACGQATPSGSRDRAGASSQALEIAPGVTVSSATYVVTGPDGFNATGTTTVGGSGKGTSTSTAATPVQPSSAADAGMFSANIPVTLSGLPAGAGFRVHLDATASDNDDCQGDEDFDAPQGGSATVVVPVTCTKTGSLHVTGTTDICPVIDGLQALPNEARVGGSMSLVTMAHDADNAPSPLTYRWLANGQSISGQTSPSLTFTCATAGSISVQVVVSDGNPACDASASLTLTCSP